MKITKEELKQLIQKTANDRAFKSDSPGDVYAAYICGAEAMQDYVKQEIEELKLNIHQIISVFSKHARWEYDVRGEQITCIRLEDWEKAVNDLFVYLNSRRQHE